jgi:hypothetical protein
MALEQSVQDQAGRTGPVPEGGRALHIIGLSDVLGLMCRVDGNVTGGNAAPAPFVVCEGS